jgi:hypothetical protein
VPASQSVIYPDAVTRVWADSESPVTISVGNDTLQYGTTTSLGSSISAGQSHTFYSTIYVKTTADSAVVLRYYDAWDPPTSTTTTPAEIDALEAAFINIKDPDYGAVGDGVTNDSAAFAAAIAATGVQDPNYAGGDPYRGPTIFVPAGIYKINSSITINKSVHLIGAGVGGDFASTILRPPDGTPAIIVDYVPSPEALGTFSTIENIQVSPVGKTNPTGHGFVLRARATLRNCSTIYCGGNGVHIDASTPDDNANLWRMEGGRHILNEGHGVYTHGTDANQGVAIGVDCTANEGYGFYEESFLGNVYIGCHTAQNVLGGYAKPAAQAVNSSTFVGCYTEGGQADDVNSPAIMFGRVSGGTDIGNGAMIEPGTGGKITATPTTFYDKSPHDATVNTDKYVQIRDAGSAATVFRVKNDTDGEYVTVWGSNSLIWKHDSSDARQALTLTGTGAAQGAGQAVFQNGLYLGATTKILTGTSSPEGVVTATVGWVFLRTDGGAGTSVYVKESGSGNTGWVALGQSITGAATTASTATMPVPTTPLVLVTGTADITSITAGAAGQSATYKFASTAATNGVVDGSNLKLSANLAYTADDTLSLICDATNWYETGRSVS